MDRDGRAGRPWGNFIFVHFLLFSRFVGLVIFNYSESLITNVIEVAQNTIRKHSMALYLFDAHAACLLPIQSLFICIHKMTGSY